MRFVVLAAMVLASCCSMTLGTQVESETAEPISSGTCLPSVRPDAVSSVRFSAVYVRNDGVLVEKAGALPEQHMVVGMNLIKPLGKGRNAVAFSAKISERGSSYRSAVKGYFGMVRDWEFTKSTIEIVGNKVKVDRTEHDLCSASEKPELFAETAPDNIALKKKLRGRPVYRVRCVNEASGVSRELEWGIIPTKREMKSAQGAHSLFAILRHLLGQREEAMDFKWREKTVVVKPFVGMDDPEFRFISKLGSGVHKNVLEMYGYLVPLDKETLGHDVKVTRADDEAQNTCHWIVMEMADTSLEGYLEDKYHHQPEIRRSLMSQVLDAVSFLSSQRILHRDLKPDNFLVQYGPDGNKEQPTVKMMDFGLSIDIDQDEIPKVPVGLWNWQDAVRPPESRFDDFSQFPFGREPVWGLDIWGVGMIGLMMAEDTTHFGVKYDDILDLVAHKSSPSCYGDYIKREHMNKLEAVGAEFAAVVKSMLNPEYFLRASPEECYSEFAEGGSQFFMSSRSGRGGDISYFNFRTRLYKQILSYEVRGCKHFNRRLMPFKNKCGSCGNLEEGFCPGEECVPDICAAKVSDPSLDREVSCDDIINEAKGESAEGQQTPVRCLMGGSSHKHGEYSCPLVHFCLAECNTQKLYYLQRMEESSGSNAGSDAEPAVMPPFRMMDSLDPDDPRLAGGESDDE